MCQLFTQRFVLEAWEVEVLLSELESEVFLLSTQYDSEAQARQLVKDASGWISRRQWVVPWHTILM